MINRPGQPLPVLSNWFCWSPHPDCLPLLGDPLVLPRSEAVRTQSILLFECQPNLIPVLSLASICNVPNWVAEDSWLFFRDLLLIAEVDLLLLIYFPWVPLPTSSNYWLWMMLVHWYLCFRLNYKVWCGFCWLILVSFVLWQSSWSDWQLRYTLIFW